MNTRPVFRVGMYVGEVAICGQCQRDFVVRGQTPTEAVNLALDGAWNFKEGRLLCWECLQQAHMKSFPRPSPVSSVEAG